MSIEYAFQIVWSSEDEAYIAMTIELPGCIADGQTQEEAIANLKVAIKEWIEVANEDGRKVPQPMSVQEIARSQEIALAEQQKRVQAYIQQEVQKAVTQVVETFVKQQTVTGWANFQGRGFFQNPEELVTSGEHHHR